jgi:hypothetical protein
MKRFYYDEILLILSASLEIRTLIIDFGDQYPCHLDERHISYTVNIAINDTVNTIMLIKIKYINFKSS